ncbi:MAG: CAP domain-containing protein [Vicinamibacterales bacterium]
MHVRHSGSSRRDRRQRLLAALGLALCLPGCAAMPAAPSPPTPASIAGNVQLCVDEINRYRATIGRPALGRSDALDNFAAQAAEHDHAAGVPHQYFRTTNGGGVAMAETELLHWTNLAVRDVIKEGLAGMWAVGPGGEHYGILSGNYTQVGCGVYVNGTSVSVAQDFR